MKEIFIKELKQALNNYLGYIIVFLFSLFANFLFIKDIFVSYSFSFKGFFLVIPWLFLIFIPALTMRSFSEEKRLNTIEVLLTLPVSEIQIILGKFFSHLVILKIALVLTMFFPVASIFLAKTYLPEIIVGYLGLIFLAGFFVSIGLYFSNLTKNQVVAFLSTILVTFSLVVISTDFFANLLPRFLINQLIYFSPLYHFENFSKGVIDLRSVFYFISATTVFLFLTIIDLEKKQ